MDDFLSCSAVPNDIFGEGLAPCATLLFSMVYGCMDYDLYLQASRVDDGVVSVRSFLWLTKNQTLASSFNLGPYSSCADKNGYWRCNDGSVSVTLDVPCPIAEG